MRELDSDALQAMALGCAVLGAGGGGDSWTTLLQAQQAAEDFAPARVVDVDELPGDALIMPCGGVGASLVSIEKIENGCEGGVLRDYLEYLTGKKVAALMPGEIGGGNGLLPVSWASRLGLPLVDADGMGRAFPLVSQVSMHLAGIPPCPAVMTDERSNVVVFRTIDGSWAERLERAAADEFGGVASTTDFTLTAEQARTATIRGSISLAIRIGTAIRKARKAKDNPVDDLVAEIGAFRLIGGKVTDVDRQTAAGFVRGSVVVEGLGADVGRLVRLELQNEHLVALEQGRVLASVPDLISVLDSVTAEAIGTEHLRYGQRVTVIALKCNPVWRTEPGIAATGPRVFGYEFDYEPVEKLMAEAVGDCRVSNETAPSQM